MHCIPIGLSNSDAHTDWHFNMRSMHAASKMLIWIIGLIEIPWRGRGRQKFKHHYLCIRQLHWYDQKITHQNESITYYTAKLKKKLLTHVWIHVYEIEISRCQQILNYHAILEIFLFTVGCCFMYLFFFSHS